jgi:ubiquinone/menaquinone biosynthesis C-methylase UbiE
VLPPGESYLDQFSAVAGEYASHRPSYPDALFTYLGSQCPGHELAWDCGAGSGQATLPLIRSFRRVVATDASAAMLAHAPRHPAIEYRVAPAHSSGLDSASVDLVTVAQALHWFDVEPFYAEVERVLVPGGVLAAWTYSNQLTGHAPIDRILARYYHEVVGPFWAPERRHVESGYASLPFPFPELPSPGFTMEQHWSLNQLLGYVATWSATQRCRELTGIDPVVELRHRLLPEWGEPAAVRRVLWPLSMRAGRKPA